MSIVLLSLTNVEVSYADLKLMKKNVVKTVFEKTFTELNEKVITPMLENGCVTSS